jgi:hypothetical protein
MEKRADISRWSSSLASEFYVAYQIYRRGYHALVTYANMKAVDLVALRPDDGQTATLDVKSIKNKTNWPLTLRGPVPKGHHFYVFVSYADKFTSDPSSTPEVWVVPAKDIAALLRPWSKASKKQTCVPYRDLNLPASRKKYGDAWDSLFKGR